MRRDRTAVIVNDRGEAFVGWRSACYLSESGYETYRSVPHFAKETTLHHSPLGLWPSGASTDRPYRINRPHVFSSRASAERAMSRICFGGRLAVVS